MTLSLKVVLYVSCPFANLGTLSGTHVCLSVFFPKCVSCPVPFSSSEHRGLALSSSGLGLDDHAFCGPVSKVYMSVNIV